MLEIKVDTHLRIKNLSTDWIEGLARLVSVPNEAKETAIREHVRGASNMDDLITMANLGTDEFILPRGFKDELEELLIDSGIEHAFIDNTSWGKAITNPPKQPELKPGQNEAIDQILNNDQGRIIAPPGKGKTVIGLYSTFQVGRPTLIVVDKKHIAQQWVDRAKEHFDTDIGFIGDDKWEEKEVTVAIIQTLWSRKDQLDADEWWQKWSMLVLDEQHHIPAETFTEIIQRFPARKRFGLSATIGKTKAKKRVSELIFGPILFESESSDILPKIYRVATTFDFDYIPTHRNGKRVVRNNYQKMMDTLTKDPIRNNLIADLLCENKNNANLIVSHRIKHLESIRNIAINNGFPEENCAMLTGNETLDERMEIYKWAEEGNCAIFSTQGVAGEALDIPRLDRLYLAYPVKNEETLWQLIGRIARVHEDKKSDSIVYDFVDELVDVLRGQANHRLRECYQPKRLECKKI